MATPVAANSCINITHGTIVTGVLLVRVLFFCVDGFWCWWYGNCATQRFEFCFSCLSICFSSPCLCSCTSERCTMCRSLCFILACLVAYSVEANSPWCSWTEPRSDYFFDLSPLMKPDMYARVFTSPWFLAAAGVCWRVSLEAGMHRSSGCCCVRVARYSFTDQAKSELFQFNICRRVARGCEGSANHPAPIALQHQNKKCIHVLGNANVEPIWRLLGTKRPSPLPHSPYCACVLVEKCGCRSGRKSVSLILSFRLVGVVRL